MSRFAPGMPCWADIGVRDHAAAAIFYSNVIGWTIADPDPSMGNYSLATIDGAALAGFGEASDPPPARWTLSLASDDVAATAEAIRAAGGTIIVEPFDMGDLGELCIADDVAGARFAVWQGGADNGFAFVGEPGALAWVDLRSTDPKASQDFYQAVFGYQYTPLEMAGPDYVTFALADGQPIGGMGGMMGQEGMTSHWLVYFAVEDVAASMASVAAHGGTVVTEPFETPYGTMGPVQGPEGEPFWLVQLPDQATA
jgi:predicted enzyme related to lactoylglutathione lyase